MYVFVHLPIVLIISAIHKFRILGFYETGVFRFYQENLTVKQFGKSVKRRIYEIPASRTL